MDGYLQQYREKQWAESPGGTHFFSKKDLIAECTYCRTRHRVRFTPSGFYCEKCYMSLEPCLLCLEPVLRVRNTRLQRFCKEPVKLCRDHWQKTFTESFELPKNLPKEKSDILLARFKTSVEYHEEQEERPNKKMCYISRGIIVHVYDASRTCACGEREIKEHAEPKFSTLWRE